MKHLGDIPDINAKRQSRGLPGFFEGEMQEWMYAGGIHVVRQYNGYNDIGGILGYAVVDRVSKPDVAQVKDIWVDEGHRRRGLGGYLVNKTLCDAEYLWGGGMMRTIYPPQHTIVCGTDKYRTFQVVDIVDVEVKRKYLSEYLTLELPEDMVLVRTTPHGPSSRLTEIILNDRVIDYRVDEGGVKEGEIEWWAFKALNGIGAN